LKLNLLPAHVAKRTNTGLFIFLGALLALLGVGAAIWMVFTSQQALADAVAENERAQGPAADAVATAKKADDIIARATVITKNAKLAEAMMKHNSAYPDLYAEIRQYIPSFYRVNSMTAAPNGAESATITLTGYIQSFRQYADLALALWRVPNVVSVSRAGFTNDDPVVPGLSEIDQVGSARRASEEPLPSEPMARMDALIARASAAPTGFQNVGGFGTSDPARGAMPGWSEVTMVIVQQRNIQTPDPRATIMSGGGAPATGFGAPAGMPGVPGRPGGQPGMAGGARPGGPGAPVAPEDER
jgi:hypothetical protein